LKRMKTELERRKLMTTMSKFWSHDSKFVDYSIQWCYRFHITPFWLLIESRSNHDEQKNFHPNHHMQ
jgi:hypothetical protein